MALTASRGATFLLDDLGRIVGYIDGGGVERDLAGNPITSGTTPTPSGFTASVIPTIAKLNAPYVPQEIDIHNLRVAEPLLTLSLPSPYYPAQPKDHAYGTPVCHMGGWNGWKYWMVGAPFPGSNNIYENPCIYVSNDGENFQAPAGITNPIFGAPAVGNYSDPQICFAPDFSKLYIIWVWEQASGTIPGGYSFALMISESSDGIRWSAPVAINGATTSTNRADSPSLFWNGNGWSCIYVQSGAVNTPLAVITTSSATPYSGWSAPTTVSMPHPLSRNWWHCHFIQTSDGQIVGMAQDNGNTGGVLYTCSSSNGGLTFSVAPFSAIGTSAGGSWYRPSLCVCADGVNQNLLGYFTRLSPMQNPGTFQVQKARLTADAMREYASRAVITDMVNRQINPGMGVIVFDSFTRADAATIGTADSGQSWTTQSGTMGISGNTCNSQTTGNNIATIDPGLAQFDVSVTISVIGTSYFLVFNYQDTSNFWRIGLSGGALYLHKIVAGSIVLNYNVPGIIPVAGSKLRIARKGKFFTAYYNDRIIDSLLDAQFASNTKVGLQATGAAATSFDNFIVCQA